MSHSLIDSPLALVLTALGTVAPLTDRTTVCIQILGYIVHTYSSLGLKLLSINAVNQ